MEDIMYRNVKRERHRTGALGLAAIACSSLVLAAAPASADSVTAWILRAGRAACAACLAPTGNGLVEARMYAMVHVAIHDALNAIHRRYQPYAFDDIVHAPTSPRSA